MIRYKLLSMAAIGLVAAVVAAQPEPWRHPDGTFHYYAAMIVPGGVTWPAARESAAAYGGYPATLTSPAENSFLYGMTDADNCWRERPASGLWAGLWLGGYQVAGAPRPDSGWQWVTGEPFGFRNWSPGEPDRTGGNNALHFGEAVQERAATWDATATDDDTVPGYLLELSADTTTVGLLQDDSGAAEGYRLFAPMSSRNTYLIGREGRLIHEWHSDYQPGLSACLLEDGRLLRPAQPLNPSFPSRGGGIIQLLDWDGTVDWSFNYSTDQHCQHHAVKWLPSGHVLFIAWERKTRGEAIAAGRDTLLLPDNELWPECLIEVDPATDSTVWEWHAWDHLVQDYDSARANYGVVAEHPELLDLNCRQNNPGADLIHANAVDYNPQFDQLVLSAHNLSEIWVIDHSTTTAEARSHAGGRQGRGGDLLYRWGNPAVYRAGGPSDQKLFGQHDIRWIEPGLPGAGHFLVFNNGPERGFSTVDEFIPPVDSTGYYAKPAPGTPYGPPSQCWVYAATPPNSLFSQLISGAQRLPSGNTMVCEGGTGRFFEVQRDSQLVWTYINPIVDSGCIPQGDDVLPGSNSVFRILYYPADYPGLAGRDLTPGFPLERYSAPALSVKEAAPNRRRGIRLEVAPNPARSQAHARYALPGAGRVELRLYDATGRLALDLGSRVVAAGTQSAAIDASALSPGVYVLRLVTESGVAASRLTIE